MAGNGEEDKDYESDPEEVKMSLKMRRREASDDEDEEGPDVGGADGGTERGRQKPVAPLAKAGLDSDEESDGQGAAVEYDDEEEEYYDDEEEELEEEEYEQEVGDETFVTVEREVAGGGHPDMENRTVVGESGVAEGVAAGQTEQEKKENEPFSVPTAGAFYMHDDRFRDNVAGRHRSTFGGRRLWESKDDRKWGHDKYEELNTLERQYEQRRKSYRGRSRGRARGRGPGPGRGYARGNNQPKTFDEYNNQNVASKVVRGRGPRRYQPLTKHRNEMPPQRNVRPMRPTEKASHTSLGRVDVSSSNKESENVPSQKVASNLNIASPPFYPSGSSTKAIEVAKKRDIQTGSAKKNTQTLWFEKKQCVQQANPLPRGENIVDSIGMDKLSVDDSSSRSLANMQAPAPALPTSGGHASQPRDKGSGLSFSGPYSVQASSPQNHFNRASLSSQVYDFNRNPVQGRGKAFLPESAQQLGQHPGSASQGSSSPRSGLSIKAPEAGNSQSSSDSSKAQTEFVGKGKGTANGAGRGSFAYGSSQVMGSGHVDPNLSGAPTFLPVMQFGGQHPGGIGVPAVGMAFPGYVPGNTEMTWLPVLAGAAGGVGGAYCPPYITVDGSYHAHPAGQTPALAASSKDNNVNKPNNKWKPQQKSEFRNDEFNQRQNKPRRYSEMSFGQ